MTYYFQKICTYKMSDNEDSSSGESSTELSSTDSLSRSSSSNSSEDALLSMHIMSYLCLFSCAGWALYNCNYRTCVYLHVSSVIILCYVVMGVLRDHSRYIENMFWHFRVLATAAPIGSMNAHMFICDGDCPKFKVLVALVAIPLILKVVFPDRNQRILDIIVWSNVHTLGLKAVESFFLLGLITSFWQTFYYLVTQNSKTWLDTSPDIPFNLGLSGMCWCIFFITFFHQEAIKS